MTGNTLTMKPLLIIVFAVVAELTSHGHCFNHGPSYPQSSYPMNQRGYVNQYPYQMNQYPVHSQYPVNRRYPVNQYPYPTQASQQWTLPPGAFPARSCGDCTSRQVCRYYGRYYCFPIQFGSASRQVTSNQPMAAANQETLGRQQSTSIVHPLSHTFTGMIVGNCAQCPQPAVCLSVNGQFHCYANTARSSQSPAPSQNNLVQPSSVITDVCFMPLDIGTCSGGVYTRYYYDQSSRRCKPFTWSGCGGNDNRFTSLRECRDTCVM